ncbi:MAG TPA: DUF5818 domain-containing protein [Thermoanaerobaculia bacterium]
MKKTFFILLAVVVVSGCAVQPQSEQAPVSESPGVFTITGVVTAEGVECPAVRGDNGTLYTIAGGDRQKLREGVRVRITGTAAQISFCMQGTTINATTIEVLP